MRDVDELGGVLQRIDGRGYKAYKELRGRWSYPEFTLVVDHVQGDPFADPTRVTAHLDAATVALERDAFATRARALGTAAHLARAFAREAKRLSRSRGSGKSGKLRMEHPGQKVMRQTAVHVDADGGIEARFVVGLPANGRRVSGKEAKELLLDDVPKLVETLLRGDAREPDVVERAAAINEDAEALRDGLTDRALIAFVADGAVLPRRSGIDDRPLEGEDVVPWQGPDTLRVTLPTPNAGDVVGTGVPEGVTLVVGGGFHGKSTLLRALEAGVYNHRPGDGRERVVTRDDAVKIRAEDGRSIVAVDISRFIDGLPFGRDTTRFTTPNASGSTSQAAAIVEAMEVGARVLLVDEDTSATNFMIRDRRMQALVPSEGEPITPFVDQVRKLHTKRAVSSVLVIGGSGDYLDVADHVIRMDGYLPRDVTAEASDVATRYPTGREVEATGDAGPVEARVVDPSSLDPRKGRRDSYVRVPDERTLVFGSETIDLAAVEQLVSRAQIRSVGRALVLLARRLLDEGGGLAAALDELEKVVAREGLDALDERRVGDLSGFRRFEVAAALNRLRGMRVDS